MLPALLLALSGCQTTAPAAERPPAPHPAAASAEQAPPLPATAVGPRYQIDPASSEVRILVYRGGPLARLGHNHVIVGPLRGEIRAGATSAESGFRLELVANELQVDPPAARAAEGEAFSADVSDQARQGTRDNMLGERLLDVARYPHIVIASVSLTGPRWNPDVTADVTLHGTTSRVSFPAAVVEHGDALTVVARLALALSAFGIEPFSVLGGGLKVEDRVDVRVRVVAERSP